MRRPAKHILIVDDDPHICRLLREHLGRDYEAESVPNGSQAFGAMLRRRPDLIVLDINLPGLGGGDVLKAFREIDATIPVLVITGDDNRVTAEEARQQGARGYLLKPFDLGDLDGLIRAALHGATRETR